MEDAGKLANFMLNRMDKIKSEFLARMNPESENDVSMFGKLKEFCNIDDPSVLHELRSFIVACVLMGAAEYHWRILAVCCSWPYKFSLMLPQGPGAIAIRMELAKGAG